MSKLADLKNQDTDREKINAWLDLIGETDSTCRAEVLKICAANPEARRYYVKRHDAECIKVPAIDRKTIAAGDTE